MKKLFSLLFLLTIIYILFICLYHPNVIRNSSFSREGKFWKFQNSKIITSSMKMSKNGYLSQDFFYPIYSGLGYKISLSAKRVFDKIEVPILCLYLDGICYSCFKINSLSWKEYTAYIKPLSCQSKNHKLEIRMISNSECYINNISLCKSTFIFNKSSIDNITKITSFDYDCQSNITNWSFSDCSYSLTNFAGIYSLNINVVSTNAYFCSPSIAFSGGRKYFFSTCFNCDNSSFLPNIYCSAKSNNSYKFYTPNRFNDSSWLYTEKLFTPPTNSINKFLINFTDINTVNPCYMFFSNFNILDLDSVPNDVDNNYNLLLNSKFDHCFENWSIYNNKKNNDKSLPFSLLVDNDINVLLINSGRNASVLYQDINVVSGVTYRFSCDFKYLSPDNDKFHFGFSYLDDKGKRINRYKELKFKKTCMNSWNFFEYLIKCDNTSKARFLIQPQDISNFYIRNLNFEIYSY